MRHGSLLLAVAFGLTACAAWGGVVDPDGAPFELSIGATSLQVELVTTPAARAHGLMGRSSLPPSDGMVFLFDGPTTDPFWMKGTLIPLSIAFWDERDRIVAILDMQPCEADPCPPYVPDDPYVGAVEANLGFFREHGVEAGDRVQLTRLANP